MNPERQEPTRRALFRAAGLGVGAAVAVEAAPGRALAAAAAIATPSAPLWTREYWAKRGKVSLYLYRKRRSAPDAGAAPLPVLFLVHGSSIVGAAELRSQRAGPRRILADERLRALWLSTSGRWITRATASSSATDGNSDIASGVEDLTRGDRGDRARNRRSAAAISSANPPARLRAGAFAMAEPDHVDRLVLAAFTYTGKGSPTLGKRAEQVEYLPHPQSPPARPRDDREHLHPRQARHLRSRACAEAMAERRTGVWRHRADRHLSRHDRESAGGRSGEDRRRRCCWCAASMTASPPTRTCSTSSSSCPTGPAIRRHRRRRARARHSAATGPRSGTWRMAS